MKKIILIALALCSISHPNNAQTIVDGVLSDARNVKGDYVVPEGVTQIADYAFFGADITSITFPKSLKEIGNNVFHNCQKLQKVHFASDGALEVLGSDVFSDCSAIVSISLPHTIHTIGARAFWYNEKLEEITLSNSLKALPPYAFQSCVELREIILPQQVKIVERNAFAGCKNLSNVTLTAVDSIGTKAFYGCRWLSQINLPNTLRGIADSAFMRCERMKEIQIPASVRYIGDKLFRGCPKMERIVVDAANPHFTSSDGLLYAKDKSTVYECPALFASTHFIVPQSVQIIRPYCFFECRQIERITLPQAIKGIGLGALSNNAMSEFILPDGNPLYRLIDGALYRYKADDSGDYKPLGVLAYPSQRADPCRVVEGTKAIAQYAFAGASRISELTLPASLLLVDTAALLNCTALKSIYCHAIKPPVAKSGAFDGIHQPKVKLYVPKGSTFDYNTANGWQFFPTEDLSTSISQINPGDSYMTYTLDGSDTPILHKALGERFGIYDTRGCILLQAIATSDAYPIGTSALPRGVYMLHIQRTGQTLRFVR